MNLTINWANPTPAPSCNFKLEYRKNAAANYIETDVSGTTAIIPITVPASYEGSVTSNCCDSNLATPTPFGVNGYSPITVEIENVIGPGNINKYEATVTSSYGNPYEVYLSGIFDSTTSGVTTSVPYTIQYPADSTSLVEYLAGNPSGTTVVSNVELVTIAPVFDNGGQLQQLDAFTTPDYFQYYWSADTSGTTWNGAPISLPSFLIKNFIVTELDVDGTTVLAGNLFISYILSEYFATSFTSITFEVYDATDQVVGSLIVSTGPLGLRNEIIPLTKVTSPLDDTTEFTLKVLWPTTAEVDSKTFYFP
jgi:hypothetical protein